MSALKLHKLGWMDDFGLTLTETRVYQRWIEGVHFADECELPLVEVRVYHPDPDERRDRASYLTMVRRNVWEVNNERKLRKLKKRIQRERVRDRQQRRKRVLKRKRTAERNEREKRTVSSPPTPTTDDKLALAPGDCSIGEADFEGTYAMRGSSLLPSTIVQ